LAVCGPKTLNLAARRVEKWCMDDFRGRFAIFGIALVSMVYVVLYQTHLIFVALSKLHH
jgi:hypothetical protein